MICNIIWWSYERIGVLPVEQVIHRLKDADAHDRAENSRFDPEARFLSEHRCSLPSLVSGDGGAPSRQSATVVPRWFV